MERLAHSRDELPGSKIEEVMFEAGNSALESEEDGPYSEKSSLERYRLQS